MADSYLIKASTYRFQLTAKKDGVVWPLSSATVTLIFKKPDATTVTKTATISDPDNGIAYYDATTSDLTPSGKWTRAWRVVDGAVDQKSAPIVFFVIDSP